MIILDINKLSKNFGYGQLFEDVSFSLNEGESISIVGPNGCGKSTLLKMIAGLEKCDSGTISIKKGAPVAYLDQTAPDKDDNRIVIDVLKEAFEELLHMQQRLAILEERVAKEYDSPDYEKTLQSFCNLTEKFSELGGYEIETQINIVCSGLQISDIMLKQNYNDLSGGEKTLIHLAKALLIKPALFLLDEPTNHLDISRIEWLEGYIKSFRGATVIVSHDRYFLDRISNKILELNGDQSKIYFTNYSGYIIEKAKDFQRLLAQYSDEQEFIKKMEAKIHYFQERGMATNSSSLCDKAKALQTRLDRIIATAVKRPKTPRKINIEFDETRKTSRTIIKTDDLSVTTPSKRRIIFGVDVHILSGQRVAIIGNNGSGKSTFIKSILGIQDLEVSGNITIGPSAKIGYLPQVIDFENGDEKLLEYFRNEINQNEQRARSILASFQFYREDVNKRLKNLSGGERIRVRLAVLLQQQVNTLIFDEPTNHIDIPTKELLEDALEDFDGTLVFVSHDRYFINKMAERIIEFDEGKVHNYLGNYDDYRESKEKNNI